MATRAAVAGTAAIVAARAAIATVAAAICCAATGFATGAEIAELAGQLGIECVVEAHRDRTITGRDRVTAG